MGRSCTLTVMYMMNTTSTRTVATRDPSPTPTSTRTSPCGTRILTSPTCTTATNIDST